MDLHRTLHSPHNCTILDESDCEPDEKFARILMRRYQGSLPDHQPGHATFQGGLVLYMATLIESLVYSLLAHSRMCDISDIANGVGYAIKSLHLNNLVESSQNGDSSSLRGKLSRYIGRVSATEESRSEDFSVFSTTAFSDEALAKVEGGTHSIIMYSVDLLTCLPTYQRSCYWIY